ncbi:hypothetical protein [Paenibacillus sp. NPDC058174]|uniref:hypothetical protein n=1 Tax=Paenibacillus sp. NPDC058174 TaxID=3346366 RepID=UPI0036DACF3F
MRKSFDKSVCRLAVAVIVLAGSLHTGALGQPDTAVAASLSEPVKANQEIIKSSGVRFYNSLERAVQRADFAFEAPSKLPSGYLFGQASLSGTVTSSGYERIDEVSLSFDVDGSKPASTNTFGQIRIQAVNLKYTKGQDAIVDSLKQNLLKNKKAALEEKDIVIGERNVRRIEVTTDFDTFKSKQNYFLWERSGASYRLDLNGDLSEQDANDVAALLISSMKLPDDSMKKTYINKNALTVDVIDAEDLKLAAAAIGFTPKFPLKVSGFALKSAFVTSKINVSSPRNDKEALTRVLASQYEKAEPDKKNPQLFWLYQIKDDGQFKTFKANKQVHFFRIDGGQIKVPAALVTINGKEVLRTSPYQSDGKLSKSGEAGWISYFWVDKGAGYRVTFKQEQAKGAQDIITALMKTQPVKLQA